MNTIKVLFLAANPLGTTRLRLDKEIRAIDEKLRQTEFRDMFDLQQQWAVRVSDLQSHLLRHKPDVVHFSGHGSRASEIILEHESGSSQPVSFRALGQLFSVLKDNVRCVVLNACYSEQQAQAIAQHIDCVIGMSKAITDSAAISFASAFYQALGYGRDVKSAFDLGCIQIDLENLGEQDTPKLLALTRPPDEIVLVPMSASALTANAATKEALVTKIEISRVLPLVDEEEQFIGYEALVINGNSMDTWVDSATLFVNMIQYAPCRGDLEVLARYLIHLVTKGRVESLTREGTSHEVEIGGTATEGTDTRYRVEGTLVYTDDCQVRKWLIQIAVPVNVHVPAQGRARIQLLFSVDESLLVEERTSGEWFGRAHFEYEEKDQLVLDLQGGIKLEASFEGEIAPLLINPIVERASRQ